MADSENFPDLSSNEDATTMLAVQKGEQAVRMAEIKAQAEHLQDRKEVALRALELRAKDLDADREIFTKESTKRKIFLVVVIILIFVFAGFLVINGEVELIKTLVIEGGKVLLGFVGGAGFAYYRFGRQRDDDEN